MKSAVIIFMLIASIFAACTTKGDGSHFYSDDDNGKFTYHSNSSCDLLLEPNFTDKYDVKRVAFCYKCMDEDLIKKCAANFKSKPEVIEEIPLEDLTQSGCFIMEATRIKERTFNVHVINISPYTVYAGNVSLYLGNALVANNMFVSLAPGDETNVTITSAIDLDRPIHAEMFSCNIKGVYINFYEQKKQKEND